MRVGGGCQSPLGLGQELPLALRPRPRGKARAERGGGGWGGGWAGRLTARVGPRVLTPGCPRSRCDGAAESAGGPGHAGARRACASAPAAWSAPPRPRTRLGEVGRGSLVPSQPPSTLAQAAPAHQEASHPLETSRSGRPRVPRAAPPDAPEGQGARAAEGPAARSQEPLPGPAAPTLHSPGPSRLQRAAAPSRPGLWRSGWPRAPAAGQPPHQTRWRPQCVATGKPLSPESLPCPSSGDLPTCTSRGPNLTSVAPWSWGALMSAPGACSRLRMSSSMHSSGKARAPSMLSWVTPERQRAQSWHPRHHGWASGVILTTVGHGRLKAVQRPLILTEVIRHVPISVDGQEVGTTAGRMDRGFGHKALLPHGRF